MLWMAVKSGTGRNNTRMPARAGTLETIGTTAATSEISATADKPEIIGTATATPCTVKKKVSDIPVPSRDVNVTYQNLPGRE
jgi:hypothetical protein